MPRRFKKLLRDNGYDISDLQFISSDWESITVIDKSTGEKHIIRY